MIMSLLDLGQQTFNDILAKATGIAPEVKSYPSAHMQ